MKHSLLLLMICASYAASAQIEYPISFKSENDNRLIKEDDSGKYYVASGEDTTNVVFLDDASYSYKLFNKDNNLLAEGGFSDNDDELLREHKWTEYYENGNIKSTGYYYKNHPVGQWEKYYPSGKLKSQVTFAVLVNSDNSPIYGKSGPYNEYYESGKLKTTGLYGLNFMKPTTTYDSIRVVDPITSNSIIKVIKKQNPAAVKFGTWEYYTPDGTLEKKEEN
jgi:antitoxin component YwqK of YwqJK toxin-antitoxin module